MGAYLSAREAADYCGVSEKTVRNWLASGRLTAEKSAGSFRIDQDQLGPLKRKSAPGIAGADWQRAASAPGVRGPAPAALMVDDVLQLVREAQMDAVSKAEAAAMWQARAEFLAGELQQAREQLALMAPKAEPVQEMTPIGVETAPEPEAISEPARAPWWRRWLGR
jgi:excisionase family DNA binding protein